MRKIFSFLAVSADGYHADLGRGLAWQTLGPEFADYSVEQLDEVDTLVLGRTTYEELSAYWSGDLGGGLRAFETAGTVPLQLIRTRPFTAGNVLLYYRPDFTGREPVGGTTSVEVRR
jgi:dihydrofolate reductase